MIPTKKILKIRNLIHFLLKRKKMVSINHPIIPIIYLYFTLLYFSYEDAILEFVTFGLALLAVILPILSTKVIKIQLKNYKAKSQLFSFVF
jgi:hypothetical protein